ncbi:MAG: hypothetical protein ACOC3J_07755 [Gemmatimonadota bacterium]
MTPVHIDLRLIGSQTSASTTVEEPNGIPHSYSAMARTGALALSEIVSDLSKAGHGGRPWVTSDGLRGRVPPRPR